MNWQDWDRYAARPGFLEWAEPAPADPSSSRYAIIRTDCPGIRWARVSPNPDVDAYVCGGGFYDDADDHPEGAIEWARSSAMQAKASLLETMLEWENREAEIARARAAHLAELASGPACTDDPGKPCVCGGCRLARGSAAGLGRAA